MTIVLPASSILPQPVDHCATGCFIGPNAAPPGRGIRVLSLFDGIACGLTALKRANIKVDRYVAFEIDKYAISIAKKNHPEIEECGDVAGADFTQFRGFDFVIGGSPCQGFSFAGKQLNFNDPRSGLFFEFVHAVREVRPKHFLLENVVMKKEYEAVISNALGVEPIMINSALVSAQNRKRLYWSDIPIVQPADHGVLWGDIRQRDIPPGGIYYTPFGLDWIRRHEERTGKKLKIIADTDKMQMLEATMYKKYSAQRFFAIQDAFGLRYITPTECERCQTLPDGYTAGVSNTQRYKMLGNGWTVDVIAHILSAAYPVNA